MDHPFETGRAGAVGPAHGHAAWGMLLCFLAALVLVGCDDTGFGVVGPGRGDGGRLLVGSYDYRAWSDRHGDLTWWGYIDLRIEVGGRITGTYLLPGQCSDRFGPGADCSGHIGGRVYRDGTVRFGLDEGWLSHEGTVNRRSDVTGDWWSRILGYRDEGTFDLRLY